MRPSPVLHVTRELDAALRLLAVLAADDERPLTCDALAAATSIPARSLSNVLQKLRRAGIVRCRPGRFGGYRLAQPASATRLATVVAAVQGRWSDDVVSVADPVERLWQAAEADLRRRLEGQTVADLVGACGTGVSAEPELIGA